MRPSVPTYTLTIKEPWYFALRASLLKAGFTVNSTLGRLNGGAGGGSRFSTSGSGGRSKGIPAAARYCSGVCNSKPREAARESEDSPDSKPVTLTLPLSKTTVFLQTLRGWPGTYGEPICSHCTRAGPLSQCASF